MAITTYSELQTSIAGWSHRTDLTSAIPDFIKLAESKINAILQSRLQEVDTELVATIGSRYIPLPSDFYERRFLWITEWEPRDEVVFKLPEQLILGSSISTGSPEHYTIDGANIAFDYVADRAYTFTFRYTKPIILSDAMPTNWLLDQHPDLYLYGSMVQLCLYTKNMKELQIWKPLYEESLQEVFDKETRVKSRTTAEVDTGLLLSDGRGWNINDGSYN